MFESFLQYCSISIVHHTKLTLENKKLTKAQKVFKFNVKLILQISMVPTVH